MPNPNPKTENLKVIKSSERAKELGSISGKMRTTAQKMRNRKYCSSEKCPYASTCPFLSASMMSPDKLCALKARAVYSGGREVPIHAELLNSFFSLFERGKEGILNEILSSIFKIRLHNQNASTDELHEYIHTLIDIKKAFYPEKESQANTQINNNFTKPEWISRLEAERRQKERRIESEAVDTNAIVETNTE